MLSYCCCFNRNVCVGNISKLLYLLQSRVEYLIKWKGWGHKYVTLAVVSDSLCLFSLLHCALVQH